MVVTFVLKSGAKLRFDYRDGITFEQFVRGIYQPNTPLPPSRNYIHVDGPFMVNVDEIAAIVPPSEIVN